MTEAAEQNAMRYRIDIDHCDDGTITPVFHDVADDPESRSRIAAALRIIADRIDPDREDWVPEPLQ